MKGEAALGWVAQMKGDCPPACGLEGGGPAAQMKGD